MNMQQSPGLMFINLYKYCFTRLYWAVRTSGRTYVTVIGTSLFFTSSDFTLPSQHSPPSRPSQPSWDQQSRTAQGQKSNIKQDTDPELQMFLNQPELIRHFNLYRGKMDPSTHTSHTWTELLVPPLFMRGNPTVVTGNNWNILEKTWKGQKEQYMKTKMKVRHCFLTAVQQNPFPVINRGEPALLSTSSDTFTNPCCWEK